MLMITITNNDVDANGHDHEGDHLTGGSTISSMGSRRTRVVTESSSPAGETAASSGLWVAEPP